MDVKYIALVGLWFIGLTLAGIMSMRFIALLAAPFAIAFACFFGIIWKKLPNLFPSQENTIIAMKIVLVLVVALLFIAPLSQAHKVAKSEVPSMNDAWYDSLITIKNDTENGIITSWWDFGHWFVNIAEQHVTFDGGDQGKRIYWVGKSLMTPDEEQNLDILRMLNCGQNKGYERILEYTEDNYQSSELINTIIYEEKEDAKTTLENAGLTAEESDSVLEKTHCANEDLLDQYYIVSEDMVGKAGVWAHFGGWDFDRAYIYNIAVNNDEETALALIMEKTGLNEETAIQNYYDANALDGSRAVDSWISTWPNYVTPKAKNCVEENNSIVCSVKQTLGNQNGVRGVLDSVVIPKNNLGNTKLVITNYNSAGALVGSQEITPQKVTIGDANGYETVEIPNADFPYEVTIAKGDGWIKSIIAHDLLSDSAFSKLFFFEGVGMNNYEMLSDKTSFTGDRIIVYKVGLEN